MGEDEQRRRKQLGALLCNEWSRSIMFDVASARSALARACSAVSRRSCARHTAPTPVSLDAAAIGDSME